MEEEFCEVRRSNLPHPGRGPRGSGPLSLEAMNEERWSIRVRWHPYDQGPARVEWLELPPEIARASISRR